jgi:dsDNA-binding SOS-regulon protein
MMQAMPTTNPNTYNDILDDNTKTKIKVCAMRRGDDEIHQPKILAESSEKDIPLFLRLPALSVLYSDTSPDGDKEKFNKSLEQCCNTFTLVQGNNFSNVKRGMPNLESDQAEAFKMLLQQHRDLLTAAFNSDKVKCSGKDKAKKKAKKKAKNIAKEEKREVSEQELHDIALNIYIEDSHDSGMKETTWTDNGSEKCEISLKVKRKCYGMRDVEEEVDGEKIKKRKLVRVPPVFHKPTPTGEYYEKKYENYIQRGTLAIFRVRRNFFSSPMMYGSNLTFHTDVIIMCESKKRSRAAETKPVMYFEDQDDDKRQRTE